jgi:hypothetical protein
VQPAAEDDREVPAEVVELLPEHRAQDRVHAVADGPLQRGEEQADARAQRRDLGSGPRVLLVPVVARPHSELGALRQHVHQQLERRADDPGHRELQQQFAEQVLHQPSDDQELGLEVDPYRAAGERRQHVRQCDLEEQ